MFPGLYGPNFPQNSGVGVAPGTITFTLATGEVIQISDWIDDVLYSTVEFANDDTTALYAFTTGGSQTIPGGSRAQTLADSNVPRQGDAGLPQSWAMLIYSIGITFVRLTNSSATALTDTSKYFTAQTVFDMNRQIYGTFWYNGRNYTNGTPCDYPPGLGFSVFSTNNAFELAQNGGVSPRDRNALVLPIHIRENLGYQFAFQPVCALDIAQVIGGTTYNTADVKTTLRGLIKRNIPGA